MTHNKSGRTLPLSLLTNMGHFYLVTNDPFSLMDVICGIFCIFVLYCDLVSRLHDSMIHSSNPLSVGKLV